MELHLKIIGILLLPLSLLHIIFPKYFDWEEELERLSLINKQMMQVHTFFIALMLFLLGILCVGSSFELTTTSLGKKICFGLFIFWLARLVIQFTGYSSELWRKKKLETTVHIVFVVLWSYFTVIFLLAFLR